MPKVLCELSSAEFSCTNGKSKSKNWTLEYTITNDLKETMIDICDYRNICFSKEYVEIQYVKLF